MITVRQQIKSSLFRRRWQFRRTTAVQSVQQRKGTGLVQIFPVYEEGRRPVFVIGHIQLSYPVPQQQIVGPFNFMGGEFLKYLLLLIQTFPVTFLRRFPFRHFSPRRSLILLFPFFILSFFIPHFSFFIFHSPFFIPHFSFPILHS
jgi:hypothetical protein